MSETDRIDRRRAALEGIRVLEIGAGLDSAAVGLGYAGKLLAEFGAEVVKLELPEGDAARRQIPLSDAPTADGVLHRWLHNSKRSVVLDWRDSVESLDSLLDGADIVISAVPTAGPSAPTTAGALHPEALRAARPHLIAGHISDFGSDGPWAGRMGGELVLYALSGLLGSSGSFDRPPVAHGTGVAWYTAGTALAVGVLVAHWERASSGVGQVVDVAGLDAMIGAQASMPFAVSATGQVSRRQGRATRIELGILPCEDGYIASVIGRDGWERLVALLGEPALMEERFLDRFSRATHMSEASEIVLKRLAEEPVEHWFHGAQALRMPFAMVQSSAQIAECPQLNDRGDFITVEGADGRHVRMPSRPFLMHGTPWRMSRPAPLLGDTSIEELGWEARVQPSEGGGEGTLPLAGPLAGIRVIELGTAWAGPCATKILADLGADVIKIESPTHPDNARVPSYSDGELGVRHFDRHAAYHIANTSKAHVALELSQPHAQELLKRLVAGADVVLENYTPHVMSQFGLDYAALREVRPDLIMLSSCGYGHSGPWSDYGAYGWSLEPGGGIADVTGYADGPPVASAVPYPDLASALHGAFAILVALVHRREIGEGQWIDLAQYELAARSAVVPLLHYMTTGELWGRHGNRHPWYAPHNIYPSAPDGSDLGAEDAWLALAVEDDDEWPRLVAALAGALEDRAEWASFEGRKKDEETIDTAIAAWSSERTNIEAAEMLQAAGVRAAPVNRADQTIRNPQLWHREFLVRAEHEESGRRIVPGAWQRFSRTPGRVRWAATNFGAQNRFVFETILDLPAEEVDAMYARGETADEAAMERPAVASIPMDQLIAMGMARGQDPDYRAWNAAGPAVPLPGSEPSTSNGGTMGALPLTWGPVGPADPPQTEELVP